MQDKMKRMMERLSDLELDRIIGLAEADLGTLDREMDNSEVGRYLKARLSELQLVRSDRNHERFKSTVDSIRSQYDEGAITLREACAALVARMTVLFHELPDDPFDTPTWDKISGGEETVGLITEACADEPLEARRKRVKF